MSAATQARNTPRRDAHRVGHPSNPGTALHAGTLIALLASNGNAVPAGTAGSGDAVGVALRSVTGTAAPEPPPPPASSQNRSRRSSATSPEN